MYNSFIVLFLYLVLFLDTFYTCLFYTSDAADEEDIVDHWGRPSIKKKR